MQVLLYSTTYMVSAQSNMVTQYQYKKTSDVLYPDEIMSSLSCMLCEINDALFTFNNDNNYAHSDINNCLTQGQQQDTQEFLTFLVDRIIN